MSNNKKDQVLQSIIHLKGEDFLKRDSSQSKDTSLPSEPDRISYHFKPETSAIQKSVSKADEETASSSLNEMDAPFPVPSPLTQEGPDGIRYDFNAGIRLYVPAGEWKLRYIDTQTKTILYYHEGGDLHVMSSKKHFLQARIEVEKDGALFWSHDFNAKGKKVAVIMPGSTLGDTLGWFPYAVRFAQQHQCELTVLMAESLKELLQPVYPDVRCLTREEFEKVKHEFYATYYIGLFFHDADNRWQPSDFRMVGLHRTAGYILGVDPKEEAPQVAIEEPDKRPIDEPYVAIAVQASAACKYWNNPKGWFEVVKYLKEIGYRVVCIDKEPIVAKELYWNMLPHGVEDETGERSLKERARWLKHADFFIGLSSGLSWLSWAVRTPVIMISGFTHPSNEFDNPYRVFSSHVCNSCWHDIRTPFQHTEYIFCPRHKGTNRQFECTKAISPDYVITMIDRLCSDLKLNPKKKKPRKIKF